MSFELECVKKRKGGNMRLPALVKLYQKYEPFLDEQVCLAGVINCLTKHGFKISREEIYYAFKKNYVRDFHGDVHSYVDWLYSLTQRGDEVCSKDANSSISATKQSHRAKISQKTTKDPLMTKRASYSKTRGWF